MTIIQQAFSRKRRLLEAFIEVEEDPQNRNQSVIKSTAKKIHLSPSTEETVKMDCSIDTSDLEKDYPIPPVLSSRVLNLLKIKLQIFEQWELKKREALEKIYENVDILTNKEEKLEKLRSIQKEIEQKLKLFTHKSSVIIKTENDPTVISQIPSTIHNNNNIINMNKQKEISSLFSAEIPLLKESNNKFEKLVPIGPNGTLVSDRVLQLINWNQPTAATRKLLMTIFDRNTLAFHTLTGKPSPAFMGCGRPLKNQLNPKKVADIIYIVRKCSNAPERDIRSAITTKCADENKMYKQRQQRKNKLATIYHAHKENMNYSKHNFTF